MRIRALFVVFLVLVVPFSVFAQQQGENPFLGEWSVRVSQAMKFGNANCLVVAIATFVFVDDGTYVMTLSDTKTNCGTSLIDPSEYEGDYFGVYEMDSSNSMVRMRIKGTSWDYLMYVFSESGGEEFLILTPDDEGASSIELRRVK